MRIELVKLPAKAKAANKPTARPLSPEEIAAIQRWATENGYDINVVTNDGKGKK